MQAKDSRDMLRRFLKAKLRDLRVTGVHLDYEGSITLDEDFLEKADILPDEEVQVLDVENGQRFTTYVLKGRRGSGVVELNGPAARLVAEGDRIMVLAYCYLHPEEITGHTPRIVSLSPENG